jgi:hypothetical protein
LSGAFSWSAVGGTPPIWQGQRDGRPFRIKARVSNGGRLQREKLAWISTLDDIRLSFIASRRHFLRSL